MNWGKILELVTAVYGIVAVISLIYLPFASLDGTIIASSILLPGIVFYVVSKFKNK